jgi:hypothetical protein
MKVIAYRDELALAWDEFVRSSHQGTLLHTRRFLSYHGTRFQDRSLVLESDSGSWLGVFPLALSLDDAAVAVSHAGATFGGLVHQGRLAGAACLEALKEIARVLFKSGIHELVYKVVPPIYHRHPAMDDSYALFRLGAVRTRCDLSSTMDLSRPAQPSTRRKRSLKKARQARVAVSTPGVIPAEYWDLLTRNLETRHAAKPVHSLAEIQDLAGRFPEQMEFVAGTLDDELVAGLVMFHSDLVAHAQYIGANPAGFEACALDAVFDHAIEEARKRGQRYFDFGISTVDQGRALNEGLHRFKSEFGAGGVAYEQYTLDLDRVAHA